MVATVSLTLARAILGLGVVNEITPGATPDYVSDYCRSAVPGSRLPGGRPGPAFLLAGGLWLGGFRLDVLSAGSGQLWIRPADP